MRNLIKKILIENETPKGVAPMHLVYFPSEDSVFDVANWDEYDEGEFYLEHINFNNPKQVSKHSYSSEDGLLEEVREYVEDNVFHYLEGVERERIERLLNEMVIRTFVVRVEEMTRIKPGDDFFDKL